MQNVDFDTLPMLFCNGAQINFGKHQFVIALRAGQNISGFALPPELMKSIVEIWSEKVKEYETQFGKIDTAGTETGIQSPYTA
ncbi:hypothetical protein H0X32_01500 [Patescibacteria group bacterium]|nr:hypothetical protein [Patescibacteria group bacterium]